jgi:bifunctional DNA-binding transcriptional regulator/antitoxin component of YhaV-PrlF toxin-antitoxin module
MGTKVKDSDRQPRVGRISSKNQVTIPVAALATAHLAAGSRVAIEAEGPGRIVLRAVDDDFEQFVGCVTGVWPPGALDELRSEWR